MATGAKAQDIGQIIAGSKADANQYLNAYLEPFGKGEILNMGRGWFNTAKVHKKLGFDVSISAQLAIVPGDKESFLFRNADYTTFRLKNGATSATVPTFVGDKSFQTIVVNTNVNGKDVSYEFNTPTGIGDDLKKNLPVLAIPLPVAQVGIGLFKHTDLKVRYFPKTNFSGTQVGVFGVGLQHEFSDYLPFIKKVPFLHLSGLAAFNSVTTNYDLTGKSNMEGSNQRAELKISAVTLQGIASVKLAIFEIYTALGITTGKANANLNGTYVVSYTDKSSGQTYKYTVTDPIALSYTNGGISNTWGVRLNLLVLKVFADYTFANYNGAGAGVAFSFR
ncbi:MAG: hypothetical protein NVS3B15_01520 [Sediminibacterium sp.]